MFCKQCGKQLENGRRFCSNCGAENPVQQANPGIPNAAPSQYGSVSVPPGAPPPGNPGAPYAAPPQYGYAGAPNAAPYIQGTAPMNSARRKANKKPLMLVGVIVLAVALIVTAVLLLRRPPLDPVFGLTESIILDT